MKTFLCWLLLTTPVFAATILDADKPLEVAALTAEMKAAVPTLEGVSQNGAQLEIRRLTGEFTAAEVTQLKQALRQHRPPDRAAASQARKEARQRAHDKLQALGLTADEVEALR